MAMILDVENLQLPGGTDKFGHALIVLKDTLVARGWTVEGSSDGFSTFKRKGQTAGPYDVFTAPQPWAISGSTWDSNVANTISNNYAWMILRESAPSTRDFLIQRSNSTSLNQGGHLYNLQFAPSGFTQSGCSLTAVNKASSGSVVVVRNNQNAVFFGTGSLPITDTANYYMNMMVNDSAEADDVWPFYYIVWNQSTQIRLAEFLYMALEDTVPGDPEPWAFGMGYSNSSASILGAAHVGPTLNEWYILDQIVGPEEAVARSYFTPVLQVPGSGVSNVLPNIDGKVRAHPLQLYTDTYRWKGRIKGAWINPRQREYPSTVDLATASPYLCAGYALLPWQTNVVPLF